MLKRLDNVILPPEGEEDSIFLANGFDVHPDSKLSELINETRDFIDSDDFRIIHGKCVDTAFEKLSQELQENFVSASGSVELSSKSIPMVGILPFVTGCTKNILSPNANVYLNVSQE